MHNILKQHTQDFEIVKRLYKHKTKYFSHKLNFSVLKNILWFKKLLYTEFYLPDTSIEGTV